LQTGELSINLADRAMFAKDETGTVFRFCDVKRKLMFLLPGNWLADSGRYRAIVEDSDIRSESRVDVLPIGDSLDISRKAGIDPFVSVEAGMLIIWAQNVPTGNIAIFYEIRN
jgi:hypothetical protein